MVKQLGRPSPSSLRAMGREAARTRKEEIARLRVENLAKICHQNEESPPSNSVIQQPIPSEKEALSICRFPTISIPTSTRKSTICRFPTICISPPERQLSLCRIRSIGIPPKSRREKRKTYNMLTRTAKARRLQKCASSIGLMETPDSHKQQLRDFAAICRRTPSPSPVRLPANFDLVIQHSARLSGYQRMRVKSAMRNFGCDVFASKRAFAEERKIIRSAFHYTAESVGDFSVVYLQNIHEVLTRRIQQLFDAKKLRFFDLFPPRTILLAVVGDKGDGSCKFCISIGNVDQPNSPNNHSLLYIYRGDEKGEQISKVMEHTGVSSALSSIKFVLIETGQGIEEFPLKFYLTGDMLFLCAITGHRGPSASYRCCLCTEKDMSKKIDNVPMRTIAQMTVDAHEFVEGRAENCRSMKMSPILPFIEPSYIIPSSLHVVLGQFQGIFDQALVPLANYYGLMPELQSALKQVGTLQSANVRGSFTGGGVRNALRGNGAYTLTRWIPDESRRSQILGLLTQLSNLQSYGRAAMLSAEHLRDLKRSVAIYHAIATTHFDFLCGTPKFHWLVNHVPKFVSEHGFFGLLSEQGIEHFHSICKSDMNRFRRSSDFTEKMHFAAYESAIRNNAHDSH